MFACARITCLITLLVLAAGSTAPAATPKEIDAAIKKGTDHLKSRYAKGTGIGNADHGIGPTCLVGLALLEGGVPVTDEALKAITESVRSASYSQHRTYQTSLCLMYLDRLGDPVDVVRIQMLAVRLLVGQTSFGGWTYETCAQIPQAHEQVLRTFKSDQPAGKLHPEIEKYGQTLAAARQNTGPSDDNSNTQFAIIAVWMSRKHGVPVENALDLIEKRFLTSQNIRTGGWPYSVGGASGGDSFGSPAMHCAGLIALSTAIARREERRAKDNPKKEEPPKVEAKAGAINPKTNPDDPFFNPPKPAAPEPKKQPAKILDHRDRAVQLSLSGMGMILAESARAGRGALVLKDAGSHGDHDLYFFWSLERVGVIYGLDKIGGVDWYDAGAHTLVGAQAADGSWGTGFGGPDVMTSFAILFLCKSNLTRDLSSKVQKEVSTEMRAGAGPTDVRPDPSAGSNPNALIPNPVLPGATGSEAAKLAGELLRTSDKDWPAQLKKIRDAKGAVNTQALVACVTRLEGERRKAAREALAERLARMTGETLRAMAKDEEAELRRGALLAMAMKDDKAHLPDLINALLDDEEIVVRAAKAGLKSVTGQDFGPGANATAVDKRSAVSAWNNWLSKQKK